MNKAICRKCEVEFKVIKNGVIVVEHFNTPPEPYKLWEADLYKCPKCNAEIVTGLAQEPFLEHFQGNIGKKVAELKQHGSIIVNDFEVV